MLKEIWRKLTGGDPNQASRDENRKPAQEENLAGELEKIKGDRKQLLKLMRNPKIRQQVAGIYQRMEADGVDLKNEASIQAWITAHKDELEKDQAPAAATAKVEQVVRQSPKIGRNDPCVCGSGKKYKKCCAGK